MAKIEIKDALFPDCPIRNILSRIGFAEEYPRYFPKDVDGYLASPRRRRIGKKSDLCRGSPEGRILFDRPGEIFVALY